CPKDPEPYYYSVTGGGAFDFW
nr:immunoglobulin heavy chain junction region [Macaca mulatta]MOW93793.1 immunoglobulin heavy chain junction region [Macaca mulatta]MOW94306.1 immunoglobulin heavy chain junction region [Macaca mulatta]MOW95603.1 immunoglobulin heavy chain junction region [Macaca mulatta]MOW96520.1 immunoglobulin heavy chain junction region [Macaca mulatta]